MVPLIQLTWRQAASYLVGGVWNAGEEGFLNCTESREANSWYFCFCDEGGSIFRNEGRTIVLQDGATYIPDTRERREEPRRQKRLTARKKFGRPAREIEYAGIAAYNRYHRYRRRFGAELNTLDVDQPIAWVSGEGFVYAR